MIRLSILLFLIIILSGCILPSPDRSAPKITQSPTEGIIIEKFGARDLYLISGSETKISMTVRNIGGGVAKNIILQPPSIDGIVDIEKECPNLYPPIPEKNKEGESCTKEWNFKAGIYSERVTYSGEGFLGRVIYDYSTEAKVVIPIYTSDRLNVLRREGKDPKEIPRTENSEAPIHINYAGLMYLKAETYEGAPKKTYELTINFKNVGTGRVKTQNGRQRLTNITFKIPSLAKNYVSINEGNCDENLFLIRDRGSCNFKITIDSSKIKKLPNKELYLDLTIRVEYTYIEEKSSILTINPR